MEPEASSAAMQIITGFLSGPPIWVWPLLVVLFLIGWRASKPRTSSVYLYYTLPFLGLMSMQSISALALPQIAWTAFGAAYLCAAVLYYRRQGRWLLSKAGPKLALAGEWATMTAVMVMFWSNFVKGTLEALAPHMATNAVLIGVFAGIVGAAAGSFLGRSLRIVFAPAGQQPGV